MYCRPGRAGKRKKGGGDDGVARRIAELYRRGKEKICWIWKINFIVEERNLNKFCLERIDWLRDLYSCSWENWICKISHSHNSNLIFIFKNIREGSFFFSRVKLFETMNFFFQASRKSCWNSLTQIIDQTRVEYIYSQRDFKQIFTQFFRLPQKSHKRVQTTRGRWFSRGKKFLNDYSKKKKKNHYY